jgi:MFS family permease
MYALSCLQLASNIRPGCGHLSEPRPERHNSLVAERGLGTFFVWHNKNDRSFPAQTTITIGGNTFTALFLDRFGRRAFLLIGSTGCLISVICEAALTATFEKDPTRRAVGNAAVFFVFFFIIFWSSCMGMFPPTVLLSQLTYLLPDATIFVYSSELFPTYLRAQGTGIAIACFYLSSLITLTAAPIAIAAVGWKFYLVLILPTGLIYIPCIYLFFPGKYSSANASMSDRPSAETNGRSLEEIGESFGDKNVAAHWYGLSEAEKRQIEQEVNQAKGMSAHTEKIQ